MSSRKKAESTNMKIRRAALNVIMICLAAIVVISGWKVYTIIRGYMANRAVYDNISDLSGDDEDTVDFDALREVNPDVIAWIRYEDTNIDYPVVIGQDNEKYLHTLFDGTWGDCGTIFVDCITEAPFRQFNTIVYGHHMKDGSMFANLTKLKDPDFCKEHPKMKLMTPDGNYDLDIWAFLNQPSDSSIYTTNIYDSGDQETYLDLVRDLADYTTDVNVEPDDRLVILSTCAYEFDEARYIAVCRMTERN